MKFSSLTERIAGDSVDAWEVHYRGMNRLEAGEDIILLSVGQESGEYTPEPIVEAAVESLRAGRHHYTAIEGTERLREAIANRHSRLTGQRVSKENCAVFSGAQNALFSVSQCLLEPGDQVILSEPYYTTYPATVTAPGAELISVPTRAENRFQIDPLAISRYVTDRTRAIVLNSPNNPTGAVYTKQQFEAIVDLCLEHQIWLISDEVYQEILPEKFRFSPASLDRAADICITVSSLSKSHRMTGWRLGWVVAPPELIAHLSNLLLCMAYGLPTFIQDAAAAALEDDHQTAAVVRRSLDGRRQALISALEGTKDLSLFSAEGGMFVVFDIRKMPISSQDFARELLDKYDVAVLPCDGFGPSGKGLIRVSLCVPEQQLVVAAERIVDYVESIRMERDKNERESNQ